MYFGESNEKVFLCCHKSASSPALNGNVREIPSMSNSAFVDIRPLRLWRYSYIYLFHKNLYRYMYLLMKKYVIRWLLKVIEINWFVFFSLVVSHSRSLSILVCLYRDMSCLAPLCPCLFQSDEHVNFIKWTFSCNKISLAWFFGNSDACLFYLAKWCDVVLKVYYYYHPFSKITGYSIHFNYSTHIFKFKDEEMRKLIHQSPRHMQTYLLKGNYRFQLVKFSTFLFQYNDQNVTRSCL